MRLMSCWQGGAHPTTVPHDVPENDDDILAGRFRKKPHGSDTSAGRLSRLSTNAGPDDIFKQYLTPYMDDFFTNHTDCALFLQMVAVEGLVS